MLMYYCCEMVLKIKIDNKVFGFFSLLITLIIMTQSCGSEPKIVDWPIIFDSERIALTKAYMRDRYGILSDSITIEPKMVVLHWTAIETLEGSFDAFRETKLPGRRPDISSAGALNVSAHFLVDQDGTIYRLMPENYMARHVIGLNHCAIGIENVGGTKALPLTDAQLKSNIALLGYLRKKYPIDYVIGHYEYTFFEEHELWLEIDEGYRTEKTDPGVEFMEKVREATKEFNFRPLPLSK